LAAAAPPPRLSAVFPIPSQNQSSPSSHSNPRRSSDTSTERYEEPETPTGNESPLAHLKGAQQKMKDLLSRLSNASSSGAEAVSSRARGSNSTSPRSHQAPTTPVSRLAPLNRSPDSNQPESEPTPSPKEVAERTASPEAWLAQQRRRTEKLLGRLRLASEGVERDESGSAVPVWV
jgi:hypothetical protein